MIFTGKQLILLLCPVLLLAYQPSPKLLLLDRAGNQVVDFTFNCPNVIYLSSTNNFSDNYSQFDISCDVPFLHEGRKLVIWPKQKRVKLKISFQEEVLFEEVLIMNRLLGLVETTVIIDRKNYTRANNGKSIHSQSGVVSGILDQVPDSFYISLKFRGERPLTDVSLNPTRIQVSISNDIKRIDCKPKITKIGDSNIFLITLEKPKTLEKWRRFYITTNEITVTDSYSQKMGIEFPSRTKGLNTLFFDIVDGNLILKKQ